MSLTHIQKGKIRMRLGALRALLIEASSTDASSVPTEEPETAFEPVIGKFVPWPTEIKKQGPETYDKGEGTGPGEQWVAQLVGGSVVGGHSKSFDVQSPTYGSIEVKQPDGNINGQVRVEAEGMAALNANLTHIKSVVRQIDSVFGADVSESIVDAAIEVFDFDLYQEVHDFCVSADDKAGRQTAIQWIMRGELGTSRLHRLGDIIIKISDGLKRPFTEGKYVELGDTDTGISRRTDDVASSVFLKIAREMGIDLSDMVSDPIDVIKGMLSDEAFIEGRPWVNDVLFNAVSPSQAFAQADYVVLVQRHGYIMIPRSSYDDFLMLARISKGKPYFRLRR